MFRNQSQGPFIPTKSVIVKPEAQVDYNPRNQNQVRFLVPQFLGFLNPADTTLNYKIIMTGRGHPQPNGRAGVHALWRDVRIRDGTAQTTLEELQDYNVLTSTWWGYTQNNSIAAKRNLFEGRQVNPDNTKNVYYNSASQTWQDGAVTGDSALQLAIKQPIYSGILAGDKVFPVVATQGLRLEMTLDNVQRSCNFQQGSLGCGDAPNAGAMAAGSQACGLKVQKATGDDQKAALGSFFSCTIQKPADGPGGRGVNNDALPFDNNPFSVGDRLFVNNGTNTESLGVITGFQADGDKDLQIAYIPDRAITTGLVNTYAVGSSVFVKVNDRMNGVVVSDVPQAQIDAAAVSVNVVLRDMELHCSVVSPPEGYVKSMMSQIASSKGLAMDFKTYSLHRVNLNAVNGLTNQLIPATSMRAYSCLSVPLSQNNQIDIRADSMRGETDGCQNYQYVLGGHLIPDRPIDLRRYSLASPHPDALHLIEAEKALQNCGYGVRNLQRVPERFFIGRAFSKYGQVADLNSRDLSLRVEYESAQEQKLFNHYICHLRRMVVGPQGVQAF